MMNKQKIGKTRGWKVTTFLPLLALLLLTFCKPGENVSAIKSISIVGTWKMVSYKYGAGEKTTYPDNLKAIKLITPGHFTWVHFGTNDNIVYDSAGGTYVFDGVNYTENVEFGGKAMVPYFGKSQFKIKIEGGDRVGKKRGQGPQSASLPVQMFLSGSLANGYKIEEVWEEIIIK